MGRYEDALSHFVQVRDERAPTDIDIEAGTADAPWWVALRDAADRLDSAHRAQLYRIRQAYLDGRLSEMEEELGILDEDSYLEASEYKPGKAKPKRQADT